MISLILLELTFREVLADIPHDAGAVIVYLLLAVFVAMTWAGSRRRKPGRDEVSDG